MGSARKPVIVRRLSRDWSAGYASDRFDTDGMEFELLDAAGKVTRIAWTAIKWVCLVRELPPPTSDSSHPERLLHKRFTVRPRTAGLWLKMTLSDGDELEGIATNDRTLIDGAGLIITPPDTRSNAQRLYIPRSSIQRIEVAAVIAAGKRTEHVHAKMAATQSQLFSDS